MFDLFTQNWAFLSFGMEQFRNSTSIFINYTTYSCIWIDHLKMSSIHLPTMQLISELVHMHWIKPSLNLRKIIIWSYDNGLKSKLETLLTLFFPHSINKYSFSRLLYRKMWNLFRRLILYQLSFYWKVNLFKTYYYLMVLPN